MSDKKNRDAESQTEVATLNESGGVNRRRFVQGAAGLGLTASALGGMFSDYIGGISPALSADFDPKKYAGTTINMLVVGSENIDHAFRDQLPQLEEETGITVEITSPAIGPLIQKTVQLLQSERSGFELVQYLGFLAPQVVGSGGFTKLNGFLDDPGETAPDYDFGDFIQAAVNNVSIYDVTAGKRGHGSDVYAVPSGPGGSGIYFYRKDLFEEAGLQPAKTWQEFHDAAKALTTDDVAGASFIGANNFSLALIDWYTRFITSGGVLMSGHPADKNFMPQVDTPEGIHALQLLIDLLPYAPKNVTQYGFAENVDGFATGKIAQMIFWSTIAGPVFDPENSLVADVAATGPVPAAPGNTPGSVIGGWGIGIPNNADPDKKAAAWRALTWLTGKRSEYHQVDKYQITVQRNSTFENPDLMGKFPYLSDSREAIATARTMPIAHVTEFLQLLDIMNVEFNAALVGTQDAPTAAARVQSGWEDILRKAGHLA